jgi:carboxymethylenebutenolidase
MTELPVRSAHVQIPQPPNGQADDDTLLIDAYLAQPEVPGPFPAVIVFQEIFGVNDHIRDVTRRIAQLGYVAIAPAIFQRVAPNFETGYTAQDLETGKHYKALTRAGELLSDTQATIAYLQRLPQVQPGRIGTIGFCFGGHVAYLVATLPEIKATALFYGAGIATMTPGGGPPTLTCTPKIRGTVYGFFGIEDVSIPGEEVNQIEQSLRQARIPHQIFRYPADHGFFCDQRASYNPAAANDAWQRVQALFRQFLGQDPL